MGIYDRDYVFSNNRGGGRLGSVSAMSVNAWIIAINIAVFIVGMLFSNQGVPVFTTMKSPWGPIESMPANVAVAKGYQDYEGGKDVDPRQQRVVFKTVIDADTGVPINAGVYRVMPPLTAYGHFSTSRIVGYEREDRRWVLTLEVWRLVTFQFLHADIMHIGFNMLGLFMFGGIVEQQLGRRRYLAFYLACGVFGGIAYLLLNGLGITLHSTMGMTLPGLLINMPTVPLVGASAGVFGVIVACAYIAPDLRVQLIFPPIPMRLKVMAYAYVGLAAINLFFGSSNAGGEAAHLGGAISGFFLIRNSHVLRDFFDVFGNSRKPRPSKAKVRLVRDEPEKPAQDPFDAEVDRILAKIQQVGSQGLSDSEKQTLQRATQRGRSGR
ncbi:MAG: rhomboid family intramembrane serine protease [Phycisphaerales bacterium]|nr:rhomboid family intramembrane serine protease [Phycisphaerales bacterium]